MRAGSIDSIPWCALLPATLALSGCQFREPPDLLTIYRLNPKRASSGDRVTLVGDGFPEGRPATVTFRGDLFRPGVAPERDVRITLGAAPASRNAVTIPFDADAERRFVGSGAGALHTTFQGDVRVTFRPSAAGLAAVSGVLREARFDVLPASAGPRAVEHATLGRLALGFLGLAASTDPDGPGLRVTRVEPESRGEAAGLTAGDRLLEMDELTVLSESDVRVRGGARTAGIVVERDGRRLPPRPLDVTGMAPLGPTNLTGAAALVLSACVFFVLPATRFGLVLRWLARVAEMRRTQGFRAPSERTRLRRILEALLPPPGEGRAAGVAAALVLVAILAAVGWLALGHSIVSPDLDLVLFGFGAPLALLTARFAEGGLRGPSGWSLAGALAGAGRTLACSVPAWMGLAGAVVTSGRFVIAEMAAEQGGAPWRWAAFRNPGLFVLAGLMLATALPETDERRGLLPVEGLAGQGPVRSRTFRALVRLSEWSYLWTTSALAVLVFFGAGRLPGLGSMVQEARPAYVVLGMAVLFAKLGGIVLVLGAVRGAFARVAVEDVATTAARWVWPAAAAALGAALCWAAALDGAESQMAADLAGYSAAAVAFLIPLSLVIVTARSRPLATASVNPWI